MSRTPELNLAVAALDSEIRQAERTHREHERQAAEALAVLKALTAVRDRIGVASPIQAPRIAKPWAPRGVVEKAIVHKLGDGPETAEELRLSTGAAAPSLKAALARMKEVGAVVIGEGDRYSLAGGERREAAE